MESGASDQPDRKSRRSGADIRPVRTREAKRADADPGERLDEIVSSVERATGEIRREAEKEAARYLQNRRREADELLTSHRELLMGLAAGLDEAAEALRAELTRRSDCAPPARRASAGPRPSSRKEPPPRRRAPASRGRLRRPPPRLRRASRATPSAAASRTR